jgi:replicative DNA helicase
MIERPLVSMEAEHGVLGALMKKPELCEEVGAFLGMEDFSEPDNGALYLLILACHSKKITPDPLSLAEMKPELPSGTPTMLYAGELWEKVASAANAKHYARIVIERARARTLYQAGVRLMEMAQQQGSIPAQIAEAQGVVMGLSAKDDKPDVVTMREALGEVFADMQERLDGIQVMGIDFGLPDLDRIVRMFRPGNLAIIAGRPGTGKTVLGTWLADRCALHFKKGALVFSLEMAMKELGKRSLASLSGVAQGDIESGEAICDKEAEMRMTAAVHKLSEADIRICDKPGLTFARICSIARFEHRANPLGVIVVDYLSLIATDPSAKHQNRNLELGSYTRGFKALAKELGIPVVVLSQLNRSIENRADPKPKMSDLRDSGEIEQDADVIIMAHRDMNTPQGESGITEIDVVKVRHAKPGFCLLQFQGEFARFVSCEQHHAEEQRQETTQQRRPSARSLIKDFKPSEAR